MNVRAWWPVFGCALLVAASGCGQGDARDPDRASSAGGTSSSGGSSSSGGATPGGGTAGAGTAGAGSGGTGGTGSGTVTSRPISGSEKLAVWTVSERPVGAGNVASRMSARFLDGPVEWAGCTRHELGPCYWLECGTIVARPTGTNVSAGELTVTIGSRTLSLTFDGEDFSNYDGGALWNGETDVVRVDAGGGADFPAFTATLTPPSELTLVSPAIEPGTLGLALSTSSDLALAWTGGAVGEAAFAIRNTTSPTPMLACDFDAAAGAAVVPAVGLQALDPTQSYELYFYSRNRIWSSAGDWNVVVTALEYPTPEYSLVRTVTLE